MLQKGLDMLKMPDRFEWVNGIIILVSRCPDGCGHKSCFNFILFDISLAGL